MAGCGEARVPAKRERFHGPLFRRILRIKRTDAALRVRMPAEERDFHPRIPCGGRRVPFGGGFEEARELRLSRARGAARKVVQSPAVVHGQNSRARNR